VISTAKYSDFTADHVYGVCRAKVTTDKFPG
jgi:hypothetical protein